MCGRRVPIPIPCPIQTTVSSFLGFSPRERTLSRVSKDSFIPAASDWQPGMTSISCPQPDGRFIVAFRQPVSEGVSPSTVYAAIRLHEPVDVQSQISRHYIMYDDVPHRCDFLRGLMWFIHTCIHCMSGCSCFILISRYSFVAAAIVSGVFWMRDLNIRNVLSFARGAI